jgi:CRP-like cAMP-binding protein
MTYLPISAGQVSNRQFVFHSGEEGSLFYVILAGSVAVLAPYRRKDGKEDYNLLVVLKAGDSFGELALISNKPRAATIYAREDCHFAVLSRTDYLRILSKIQDIQLTERVELLQRHPAFTTWSRSALQRLSYFFKVMTYKRKQVLFRAGQVASEVFLVKSGDFQLKKSIAVDIPKRFPLLKDLESAHHSAEVTLLSVGEMIGDQEVLSNTPHIYTCICASAIGEVMRISKEDFLKRVVTDDSAGWLQDIGRLQESYRSGRLEKISKLESEKWQYKSPKVLRLAGIGKDTDMGQMESARISLKKEVRRRWHLPSRSITDMNKSPSVSILKQPRKSVRPERALKLEVQEIVKSQISPRSWLDVVKHKYFHRRVGSGGLELLEEKGTGKLALVLTSSNTLIRFTTLSDF